MKPAARGLRTGKKIIYYSSTGYDNYPVIPYLHIMNSDGSVKRRLTDGVDQNRDPDWSPDGTRIAFVTEYLGDIFLADPDGRSLQRLTGGKARATWSPLAGFLGLVPLPPLYRLLLAGTLLCYVVLTQAMKTRFIRRFPD
ncbi:MAG: PD40 domain-containing protein [Anaerolineales bacterium]|nr:PD40 domain-containing protein [Anaerolineales bacterium]